MRLSFVVGYDLEEFEKYYRSLEDLHIYFASIGLEDANSRELGEIEDHLIRMDSAHLIAWKLDGEIAGHAIWHESNTAYHRKGAPRERKDRELLEKLLGRKEEFVELHELWLKSDHRGRGYGERFFKFFEKFIKDRGHEAIVYYTDHPAAMTICRKRGYKEEYYKEEKWHIFSLKFNAK